MYQASGRKAYMGGTVSAQHQERALLLARIVRQFEQRVNEFLDFGENHPEASFGDLETEARRLSRDCFAPALQQVIWAQRERIEGDWRCECGGLAEYKGDQARKQETYVGRIEVHRGYYYCPSCSKGHYPLDEVLGIAQGQFSEGIQNGVCRLGAALPFEPAAETFEDLTGVGISAREVERLTDDRGAHLEDSLAKDREKLFGNDANPPERVSPDEGGIWAVALDAARVRFDDAWHDVKAGVVFRAKPRVIDGQVDGAEAERQTYIAEVGSMEEAGKRLYAEVVKRGVDVADDRVVCLGDGALGNWTQFALHFPNRIEVLDWWHGVDHLWTAANGVFGEGSAGAKEWVDARKADLWEGEVESVVDALLAAAIEPKGRAAADEIHYFETNTERMRYDRFREAGCPIGSGTVESACKRLIGARLKQAGMCWTKSGAQPVLSLRSGLLSQRWAENWRLTRPDRKAA